MALCNVQSQVPVSYTLNSDKQSAPGFSPYSCSANILLADSCLKTGANFQIQTSYPIHAVLWHYGDPSGNDINNTDVIAHHHYSNTGRYTVSATVSLSCGVVDIDRTFDIVDCVATTACTATVLTTGNCLENGTAFSIKSDSIVQSVIWHFHDPVTGPANTSNSINSSHIFSATGNYTITAIVQMSCGIDTLTTPLKVIVCDTIASGDCRAYLPDAFTPNGDGTNDYFTVFSPCNFSAYDLVVYNRWGELVFHTTNPSNKWDGMQNGHKCPTGTYVYVAQYQFGNLPKHITRGSVVLIR